MTKKKEPITIYKFLTKHFAWGVRYGCYNDNSKELIFVEYYTGGRDRDDNEYDEQEMNEYLGTNYIVIKE
ncbi:MAG: hypothetical protein GY679_01820 [Mycoplasma sp.]|nr:hypothetical protein [Mycoplasma sp.]